MLLSLSQYELQEFVARQLNFYEPDNHTVKAEDLKQGCCLALERTEHCFAHIKVRGYEKDGQPYFYHLHSDQYATFLYYLANSIFKLGGAKEVCDKLILLNRALHGCWFSYKGALPDVFLLVHPVGTVLGNAAYSDFLVVLQSVTVNTGDDGGEKLLPELGKALFLSAGATITGDKPVGDGVTVGVNTVIYNKSIPDNALVYTDENGKQQMKLNHSAFAKRYFTDFE